MKKEVHTNECVLLLRSKQVTGTCTLIIIIMIVVWIIFLCQEFVLRSLPERRVNPIQHHNIIPPIAVQCPPISSIPQTSPLPNNGVIKPATIMYSLSIHHKFDHFKNWMDVMWEPQHFYMIHVDSKSSDEFYNKVRDFATHYENVELSVERYNVVYYGWTVLWTHLQNFKRAIQINQMRDYFINMAGIDMPIKTPREINFFLGEHMGKSFIYEHCVWPHYRQFWRNYTWSELNQQVVQVTDTNRVEPPNLTLRWGQHYVILHRDVVEWMFQQVHDSNHPFFFTPYQLSLLPPPSLLHAGITHTHKTCIKHKITHF
eukprot:TRINITY_DN10063_c0_g1_i14.p1 TRINITY_DN10063_c0_g1~~TRINITY_DN10063_c0_g1_i14.p1  ORF type:complete len:315 (+),score=42.37 TRINITY_DN10063_c0_g1_i14:267-1211(+)